MAASGQMLGKNAKLYYNTATFSTPTWVEMPRVSDVGTDLSFNRASNATRGSQIERGAKTTGKLQVTATHEQDLTDTVFLAVWAAIISFTANLDLLVLNAASNTNGARGYRGEFDVTSTKDKQGVGDILLYDLTFEPQSSANALQTCVVGSGAPVFTTFAT